MKREHMKEAIRLYQELLDNGGTLECRMRDGGNWFNTDEVSWLELYEYRVKREPREFWLKPEEPERRAYAVSDCPPAKVPSWIKVREVIDA